MWGRSSLKIERNKILSENKICDKKQPTTFCRNTEKFQKFLGCFAFQMEDLKLRIKEHYDKCSPYYVDLWGQHIHHGYWITGKESKEEAQNQLIELLLSNIVVQPKMKLLDVGRSL